MKIKTTILKQIFNVHGNEIKSGDTVLLATDDKDLIAVFSGYTNKGSLTFRSIVEDKKFNIMPASINSIYPVEVVILPHNQVESGDKDAGTDK